MLLVCPLDFLGNVFRTFYVLPQKHKISSAVAWIVNVQKQHGRTKSSSSITSTSWSGKSSDAAHGNCCQRSVVTSFHDLANSLYPTSGGLSAWSVPTLQQLKDRDLAGRSSKIDPQLWPFNSFFCSRGAFGFFGIQLEYL